MRVGEPGLGILASLATVREALAWRPRRSQQPRATQSAAPAPGSGRRRFARSRRNAARWTAAFRRSLTGGAATRSKSPWAARLFVNRSLLGGLGIVAVLVLASILIPALSPYGVRHAVPAEALLSPSPTHLFGTDGSGLDVFTRVFYAPRTDLPIAFVGVGLGAIVGVIGGVFLGFSRSAWAEVGMRVVDLIQSLPLFVLALALVAVTGNNLIDLIWVLAFLNVPIFLRLTRSEVLTIRELRYVEAATALGQGTVRTVLKHVLPNSVGPVVVQFGISTGHAILTVAGLAFLGVGVQVPTPEWGSMVLIGASNITTGQWWSAIFPGTILTMAVIGFNLLSDGIERARAL